MKFVALKERKVVNLATKLAKIWPTEWRRKNLPKFCNFLRNLTIKAITLEITGVFFGNELILKEDTAWFPI